MPARRRGTIKKNVRLTEDGIAAIQEWADNNGVSFSAALESLARSGLGQQHDEAFAPVLISVLNRTMQQNYKSLVRLLITILVETMTTHEMSKASTKYVVLLHEQLATNGVKAYGIERYDRAKALAKSRTFLNLRGKRVQRLINELGLVFADDASDPKS